MYQQGRVYDEPSDYDEPYPYASPHLLQQPGLRHQYYDEMGDEYSQKPKLGATFTPGGFDDFYMPEVVSPTPQRIMPEVPSNMQEELAHLELEARNPPVHRMSTSSVVSAQSSYMDHRQSQSHPPPQPQLQLHRPSGPGYTASYEHTNASAYQNINRDGGAPIDPDSPIFSPFPKLRNPGPNVPLSDEDKEEVLERARPLVLKSTDPEMQLAWAQDALSWVEVASQQAVRQQVEGQPRMMTPKIEHQLREDALSIVKFLADQHHPKAEFMKSMWLEFGKFGYRVDKKEAFLSYKRAAEKGYARAEYRIGMQYENSNNSAKAIEHYQKGVALKDSASNYRLGMMTLLGQHGMHQDFQRGIDLVQFSADTADENAPQGAYVYGMLLARELPNISIPDAYLPFDLNEAKVFIEKGAYLGFAKAQLKMAQAYELCELGCEFEPALSLHYNALAARQGEAEADMAISKWFLCGYEGIFEKNEELAFTYAQRAAQAKLATAEFAMGYFFEIGMYVPADLRESEAWYQKAAEHGNTDALGRIDSIKKNNTLSKKDHEQVAISRIKSQYGSQRGGRPDRFKQKPATPLPSMPEDRFDMPNPRNSYAGPGAPLRPQSTAPPARPVSVAPYPDDDPPPPNSFNSRTGLGLRPISSSGPQADRPASAFGIRPPQHANTDSFNPGNPAMRVVADPVRPSTGMGNMAVPGGRGSNPSGRDRIVSAGWEPQVPPKHREPPSNGPPQADIGQTYNQGNPGPNRLQKPLPNPNKPAPPLPSMGYAADPYKVSTTPGYDSPIQRRDPAANHVSRPERGSSMTPITPTMSPQAMNPPMNPIRHDRHDSQNTNRTFQRPPQNTMSSQSQQDRPHSVAPSFASSNSGPPKKSGPSTFEEMGIPTGKQENDCVVM